MATKPVTNSSRRSITSNNYNPTGRSTDINPARLAEELSYHENKPNFVRQQVVKTELNVSPPASSIASYLADIVGLGGDEQKGALLYHYSEETNGFEPPPESYANSPNREFFEKAFTTVSYVNDSSLISGLKPNDIVVGQYSKNEAFDDFIPLDTIGTIAQAIEVATNTIDAYANGIPLSSVASVSPSQNCSASIDTDFAFFAEPCDGILTSGFGMRTAPAGPNKGKERFHAGIDLAKGVNTPIYAVYDGVISFENRLSLERERSSNLEELQKTPNLQIGKVIIKHNIVNVPKDKEITVVKDGSGTPVNPEVGSYETYYLHLTRIVVTSGQNVKTGDIIGYMGGGDSPYIIGTGKLNGTIQSTGAHLHFELHYPSGGVLDPYSVTGWGKTTKGNQRCTTPEIEAQKKADELVRLANEEAIREQERKDAERKYNDIKEKFDSGDYAGAARAAASRLSNILF